MTKKFATTWGTGIRDDFRECLSSFTCGNVGKLYVAGSISKLLYTLAYIWKRDKKERA